MAGTLGTPHVREVLTIVQKTNIPHKRPRKASQTTPTAMLPVPLSQQDQEPTWHSTLSQEAGSAPVCFSKGIPLWECQGNTPSSVGWELLGSYFFAQGVLAGAAEQEPCPQLIAIRLNERRQHEGLTPTVIHQCPVPSFFFHSQSPNGRRNGEGTGWHTSCLSVSLGPIQKLNIENSGPWKYTSTAKKQTK